MGKTTFKKQQFLRKSTFRYDFGAINNIAVKTHPITLSEIKNYSLLCDNSKWTERNLSHYCTSLIDRDLFQVKSLALINNKTYKNSLGFSLVWEMIIDFSQKKTKFCVFHTEYQTVCQILNHVLNIFRCILKQSECLFKYLSGYRILTGSFLAKMYSFHSVSKQFWRIFGQGYEILFHFDLVNVFRTT